MGERIFHAEQKLKQLRERHTANDDHGPTLPPERRKDEPSLADTLVRLEAIAAGVVG
jgi:hypothetical protein